MRERRAAFRQADLRRALKATREAGLDVARAEIDPATGKIVVIIGRPEEGAPGGGQVNEWDQVLEHPAPAKVA